MPDMTASESDNSAFNSLFSMLGNYGKTAVDTAVPVIAKDMATRLANGSDARALAARLDNGSGSAGANPNDVQGAANVAQKTPGELFSVTPYIYSNGKLGLIGWGLILGAAAGFLWWLFKKR